MRVLTGFVLALVLAVPVLAAPSFPKLTGRVVDEADILSPPAEKQLRGELKALEDTTTRQVVVVTLPSLQGYEIEEYGYQLGRHWKIGQEGEDNGALLIVAPNERKVRIEVGYGLEPILTDALSSVILQTAVLPKFREGDMEAGVMAGAAAIVSQLQLPEAEARANVAAAARQQQARPEGEFSPLAVLFIIFVMSMLLFGGRGRRRGVGGVLPWIILGGIASGGRGGFSGSGGSFGGGGFSGGGGSFGGGGSSGGW